ncbi:MAG: hypothetical protein HYZ83_03500 [Candidatus Omnitrophica bacterium]|nr:hypothetical protein [Candidatus Omnitrophota bacterium]
MRKGILKVLSLLLLTFAILENLQGKAFAMEKKEASSPYGVIYFSNGVTIEKIDLKTKKSEIVIPEKDENGNYFDSIYPIFSFKKNKMYFLRKYTWPKRTHIAIYDFRTQKIESTIDLESSLSLSPDEQWFAYFRRMKLPTPKREKNRPEELVIKNVMSHEERVVAIDATSYQEAPQWLTNKDILYKNISEKIIKVNVDTGKTEEWNFKRKISIGPLSPDRKFILCYAWLSGGENIFILDLKDNSLRPIKRSWLFLTKSADFWSPDGKSFIYTRQDWQNLNPFYEVGNLYWRDLATGKEQKLADTVSLSGGFWLAEDPMNKSEFENKK